MQWHLFAGCWNSKDESLVAAASLFFEVATCGSNLILIYEMLISYHGWSMPACWLAVTLLEAVASHLSPEFWRMHIALGGKQINLLTCLQVHFEF